MVWLTFAETVERLAQRAGITLRYEEGGHGPARQQQGERIRLVEAHRAAAAFYVEQLGSAEAEIGRKFLAERGFDQAAAEHFGVGYAPAGWDHLVRFLRGVSEGTELPGLVAHRRRFLRHLQARDAAAATREMETHLNKLHRLLAGSRQVKV